jgi:hypothetical protein
VQHLQARGAALGALARAALRAPLGLTAAPQLAHHLGALRGAQAAQVQVQMLAAVLDGWRCRG